MNRIIQYARTPRMAQMLVDAGANIYTVIKQRPHTLALDELSKHFPIRPFLIEATEETPLIVKKLIDAIDNHPFREGNYLVTEVFRIFELRRDYDWQDELDWYTVRHMIYNGFFPYFEYLDEHDIFVESLFFRRHNQDTLGFWLPNIFLKETLRNIVGFHWSNAAAMKRDAEKNPYSFPLILFAPHLVYKESRRAKTSMSKFVIPGKSIIIYDKPDTNEFIPVTRYAEGMSKGLYFKDDNDEDDDGVKKYCGTFYYFEPESTTFLRADPTRILRAIDKVDAAQKLRFAKEIFGHLTVPFLHHDLLMSKRDWEFSGRPTTPKEQYYNLNNVAVDEVFYAAHKLKVYALQDELDQPICEAARAQGYDVIILEKMVGSRQIVTEVLDTRPREESFGNLHFLK